MRLAPLLIVLLSALPAAAAEPIRLGLLAFGTAQWEIETMRSHRLDDVHGIQVRPQELAGKDSAAVALLGGTVDAVVGDWLWVSRQRAMGHDLTFVPWVGMTGALLVPEASPVRTLADLAGRKLGVAGGPLDKSWLLLRALAARRHGMDLDRAVNKSYGAPPLLAQQLEAGRLDALLTFWPSAVPLEAKGFRRLLDVAAIPAELGLETPPPLIGWIFHSGWAASHRAEIEAFRRAEAETRTLMCAPGFDWTGLDRLTRANDARTREGYRAGFCAGMPGMADLDSARRLYALLAELGGEELVGPSPVLQPGTFW
ncbi:putative ABC transporter (substrate-binding protein) [Paramagnetospirillum caucaseum]|uniref:Putative ABC transporter (Substrate-binding protein) n=1 Tax=Paramagnetospirillum caucaseum TaxID=1244869 RepID=M2ZQ97_9PROT|nr:ABC transporter substrate-binding protein [Paramagnetospirillum caucaseum]EME69492.1 putative ABC transporter (substrate-binding protein) [Paramagnetospirillum caucaseum]